MTMKRSGRWTGPLWWAAAVVGSALMVLVAGVMPARLHAQSPDGPAPAAVDQAARDAVAAETGAAAEALTTLRAVLVTWNDACLGIVTPDLACAQVLTPGWVVWVGNAGAAYRVHTNHDGSASRVAPGTVEAATVADQPLPAGVNVGEPVLILPPGGPIPQSDLELVDALRARGYDVQVREIALTQPWIPDAVSPQYAVGDATIEMYVLASDADATAALDTFATDGAPPPPANATLWASANVVAILNNAPNNLSLQDALSEIFGAPSMATIAGGLPPLLPPPGDGVTPDTADGDPPVGLPNAGSGGLRDGDAGTPGWAWGVIGGLVAAAVGTGAAYRFWLLPRLRARALRSGGRPAA